MDDILPVVKDALLKERKTALSIAEILRDGEDTPWYQQMEAAFQKQIQEVLDQVKENSALLSSAHPSPEIQQEADRLRGELSKIIRKKQDLKKFIARKNPWLELFRNLPDELPSPRRSQRNTSIRSTSTGQAPCRHAKGIPEEGASARLPETGTGYGGNKSNPVCPHGRRKHSKRERRIGKWHERAARVHSCIN